VAVGGKDHGPAALKRHPVSTLVLMDVAAVKNEIIWEGRNG